MSSASPARRSLKAFAFSAQLAHADLDRIEQEYRLELGHHADKTPGSDEEYYPQFDEDLRREAADMAKHYEIFYCLEKSIRRLISGTITAAAHGPWWDTGRVPGAIHEEVGKRMQREADAAVTLRSSEPLDYTTFGELGEIIKANSDLFGGIFNSQRAVERVMANLNTLRAPIAHCSPLAEDEVLRLQLSLRDWFRQME